MDGAWRWAALGGLAAWSTGCGGMSEGSGRQGLATGPAEVRVAEACAAGQVRVEVEAGVLGGLGGESPCAYAARFVGIWTDVYARRWGAPDLRGWTVRIRAPEFVDDAEHAGLTWYDRRLVELTQLHFEALPHEIRHAALGPASNPHPGWCDDFVPWEFDAHVRDERAALGCPR